MQNRVKYFLAAANCLNFTQAANQLFISQQAMTRQISLLEEELGVKLFIRSTRSVALTEAGRVCRDEFARLDADMDRAVERIRNAALANSSVITVGFYYFFSRDALITPIMESLYRDFPTVEFKIVLYDFQVMRHSLLDGESDICVGIASDWKNWSHIRAGSLKTLPFNLILSKSHPLAQKRTVRLHELADYTWFRSGNIDVVRPVVPAWYGNVPCRGRRESGDFFTALAYVSAGQGFTLQPPVFQGVDSPCIRRFSLPFPDATLDLIYACSDSMMNPLVQSIVKNIKKQFTQCPDRDDDIGQVLL